MSPLTSKGEEILGKMRETYGSEAKAKEVLYASKNAGTISGIDEIARMTQISEGPGMDAVLSWGGNVNGQTVKPGGKADTPNMPRSASIATSVGSTDGLGASLKNAASAGVEAGRKVASGELVPRLGE